LAAARVVRGEFSGSRQSYRYNDGPLEEQMAKLRFNITMSLDGYVAGPAQSLENPLGEGGTALHEWALATHSFRESRYVRKGAV
jgi:hypothetical protein